MIRTHTFNGVKYNIDLFPCKKIMGSCDEPHPTKPMLSIYSDLHTKEGLIVALHEALHAADYRQTEEVVTRVAQEAGSFLWRLGYRIKKGV